MSFCQKSQELIIWALDGEAAAEQPSVEDRQFLALHLAGCPKCRAYQQSMHNLAGSLDELPEVAPPADLADRILARIESNAGNVVALKPRRDLKKFIPLAAAAMLLAVAVPASVMFMQLNGGQKTDPGTVAVAPTQLTQTASTETTDPEAINGQAATEPTTTDSATTTGTAETPPHTGTQPASKPHSTGTAVASGSPNPISSNGQATTQNATVTAASQVDSAELELASAALSPPDDFASYEDESDTYYDPLSELVGF